MKSQVVLHCGGDVEDVTVCGDWDDKSIESLKKRTNSAKFYLKLLFSTPGIDSVNMHVLGGQNFLGRRVYDMDQKSSNHVWSYYQYSKNLSAL